MTKKLRKGLIAFLLVAVMVCMTGIAVLFARPASAEEEWSKWDGDLIAAGWGENWQDAPADYKVDKDEEGNVTVEIGSAAALAYFAHEVYIDSAITSDEEDEQGKSGETGSKKYSLEGAYVHLTTNIDLDKHMWIPIGGMDRRDNLDERRFSGTFDASYEEDGVIKNHVIKNLNTAALFENLNYNSSEERYYIEYTREKDSVKIDTIPFDVNEKGGYSYGLFGVAYEINVTNLTVEGINISCKELTKGGKKLVPDSIGVIIGYGAGNVMLRNCVVGSSDGEDAIIIGDSDYAGAYGGLVGTIYAYGEDTEYDNYQTVIISDCTSYVSLTCEGSTSKLGGIVGYVQYFKSSSISGCVNYGDIAGGQYIGGITGYWTNLNEGKPVVNGDDENNQDDNSGQGDESVGGGDSYESGEQPEEGGEDNPYAYLFDITNCDNFGNIELSNECTGNVGGIIGQLTRNTIATEDGYCAADGYCEISIAVVGCNNYGNVIGNSGKEVGGIIGWYRSTAGITAQLMNNLNYGNVFSYDSTAAGGYIGKINSVPVTVKEVIEKDEEVTEPEPEVPDEPELAAAVEEDEVEYNYYALAGNLTLSGGSLGNVYYNGSSTNVGSIFGSRDLKFPNEEERSVLGEIFYVDVGAIVSKTQEEMKELSKEHVTSGSERYDSTYDDDTFKYGDEDKTILLGFRDDLEGEIPSTLEIPEAVTTIAAGAFVGQSAITKIEFNDKLVEIGDYAFAGTGLTELVLPEGLEKIGAWAFLGKSFDGTSTTLTMSFTSVTLPGSLTEIGKEAFASCKDLNHVILPDNAENIKVGEGAFKQTADEQGAFLIAKDTAQYKHIVSAGNFRNSNGVLTHVITINYNYSGQQIHSEERLFGQSYTVTLEDGIWKSRYISTVGPTDNGNEYVWYDSAEGENIVTEVSDLNVLLSQRNEDSFTLYAFSTGTGGKLVFIPASGVVYEKGTSYTTIEDINTYLLRSNSAKIDSSMEVTVNGKKDNWKISDAGDYQVVVTVGPKETHNFTVTIKPAPMDLSSLANLEWNITKIGDIPSSAQLMSYNNLYIYTYSVEAESSLRGKEYPSRELLNDTQIKNLKLNSNYATRDVSYSVVRNRGDEVTINIIGDGYTVTNISDNTGRDVGRHKAEATITSNGNYIFTESYTNSLRGLEITPSQDGTSAVVKKVWYIVDFSNWLVNLRGEEYSIPNHVFGNNNKTLSITAPSLRYGDVNEAITMHLSYNGTTIGGNEGFGVNRFTHYINRVMPAGEYSLQVVVASVTSQDEGTTITHNGFTETFTFTVSKASFPMNTSIGAYSDLVNSIKGKTFTLDNDTEKDVIYDSRAEKAISNYFKYINSYEYNRIDTSNTIWANYGEYYGNFITEFNLDNDKNEEYHDMDYIVKNSSSPATYRVYYRFSSPNYYSSVENLGAADSRYNYYFDIVRYEMLDVPTIDSFGLIYNGNMIRPDIPENSMYEIIFDYDNDDYTSGGEHTVWFQLYDIDHYRWRGETSSLTSATFVIAQAENVFTVSLNMLGWNYGSFNVATNNIRAASRFSENGVIYFSIAKKGESAPLSGLDKFTINGDGQVSDDVAAKLKALSTGEYVLSALVPETGDYLELKANVNFLISQAINTWKDGDDDLVIPNWIVGKYNAEENPIVIRSQYGTVNFKIVDIDGNEYYNSTDTEADLVQVLNGFKVGKYMILAWVNESGDFAGLAERMFTIQVFEKPGLPWWGVLLIVIGALGLAALVIFILWKQGVFRIVTDKILVSIRTRVSVEATIASVRAAKMMEEGRKSVEEAKRREEEEQRRLEEEKNKGNGNPTTPADN